MKAKIILSATLSLSLIPNLSTRIWADDPRNDPRQQGTQKPQPKILDCFGKTEAEIRQLFDGSPPDSTCGKPVNPITDQVRKTKNQVQEEAKKVTTGASSKNADEKAKERHGLIAKLEKLPGKAVPKDARFYSILMGSIIGLATGIVTGNVGVGFLVGAGATAGFAHYFKYLKNH